METKALLFPIDCFERCELAKMNSKELYALALESDDAQVLTMDELSYKINDDMISLDHVWTYFVETHKVWVFTAEQAWDGDFADTIVKVFSTEKAAQKYMHDFLEDDGGEDSIRDSVKREGWTIEMDEPNLYRACEFGYYGTNHVELTITQCDIL